LKAQTVCEQKGQRWLLRRMEALHWCCSAYLYSYF